MDASEPLQNRQNNVLNGRPNLPDKDRRSDAAAGAARQADRNHGPFQAARGFRCIFVFFSGRLVRRLELSAGQAERSSLVIRPLAVIGNVEAFELGLLRCPEADGQVDELVEDQRAET